jgi:hypothetical protein
MSRNQIIYMVLSIVLIVLAFTRALDGIGSDRTEQALQRALATYAIARALNGVISVAQGTELAIEPAGIGVVLAPGEILDPVNDLIERFSWVMLASSASLGVINVLLAISAWIWSSVVMSAGLLLPAYLIWRGKASAGHSASLIFKLAIVLVILRFSAPVLVILNDFIYQQFLSSRYQTAVTELDETRTRVSEINSEQNVDTDDDTERSLMDQARALYESTTQHIKRKLDMEQNMADLNDAATNASRAAIDLIVIFVFQTILLPLVFIWIIWYVLKQVINRNLEPGKLLGP